MGKNIVVITGSPRMKGNTNALADAFIKAVCDRVECKVVRFEATNMSLSGCRACHACFTGDKACPSDDSFNRIASHIEAADAVVMAMPVYWFSIPAQIKCVVDKLYAFTNAHHDVSGKQFALLACCADSDMSVFDGVRGPMKRTADLLGWEYVGEVLVPGVWEAGDILKTGYVAQVEELASKF